MANKERIDVLIVQKGLVESREKAQSLIMAGQVYIDEVRIDKAGTKVDIDSNIDIRETLKYVSRGGLKLEKAVKVFKIHLQDKVCMDIGASTGGFTDCMLQNGAKKVYAVDVGYGQLAWTLRQDSRVVSMERTNIRYVKPSDIEELLDFASVDVSFISLTKIFRTIKDLLKENAQIVCLIKPQFEAGRDKVGKKGVVRDSQTHKEVLENILEFAEDNGFYLQGLDFSPIKGPEGNIEYLAHLDKAQPVDNLDKFELIKQVVSSSHMQLDSKASEA